MNRSPALRRLAEVGSGAMGLPVLVEGQREIPKQVAFRGLGFRVSGLGVWGLGV